jgi:hypothetical protein
MQQSLPGLKYHRALLPDIKNMSGLHNIILHPDKIALKDHPEAARQNSR